jgi:hypothetical protein
MSMVVTPAPREVLRAIRAEYDQMPGMRLTRAQFRRLWGLDGTACDSAILELIGLGYLQEDPDGRLQRAGGLPPEEPPAEPV